MIEFRQNVSPLLLKTGGKGKKRKKGNSPRATGSACDGETLKYYIVSLVLKLCKSGQFEWFVALIIILIGLLFRLLRVMVKKKLSGNLKM